MLAILAHLTFAPAHSKTVYDHSRRPRSLALPATQGACMIIHVQLMNKRSDRGWSCTGSGGGGISEELCALALC